MVSVIGNADYLCGEDQTIVMMIMAIMVMTKMLLCRVVLGCSKYKIICLEELARFEFIH